MNRCPACGFESESQYCPNCGSPTTPVGYSQPQMSGGNSYYGSGASGDSILARFQALDGWKTWIRIFLILCVVFFAWSTIFNFSSWINSIIAANDPYATIGFMTVMGWINSLLHIALNIGALVGAIVALSGKKWGGWLLFICWFL